MQKGNHRLAALSSTRNVACVLAWVVAVLFLLNALYFVLRASSPVIRDDSWYFLDVFLRKAINGSLGLGDFFVRRMGADHSQPLFKLVLLFEWRYFDLDFVVGAVIGVFAAAACALVFFMVIVAEQRNDRGDIFRYLAWAAICAVLFTLNADAAIWTWPLVALENVTSLIILLFVLVVWHAHRTRRYVALVLITFLLGISSDDSALIAVIAVVVALLLMQLRDPTQRDRSTWKLLAFIVACTVLVRIGYINVPIVGGMHEVPLSSRLGLLIPHFQDKGWWMWAVLPLTLPVFYRSPTRFIHVEAWPTVQIAMGVLLFAAHLWFWRTAFRGKYNRAVFVAACLMLVSYGWVAGIILGRVATAGNDYLNQPRYVLLYGGHLIALLLMWAGSINGTLQPSSRQHILGMWLPTAGCVVLLAGQILMSRHEWQVRPYLVAYYASMAHQVDDLTRNPEHVRTCAPELPVCRWPLAKRRELTQLLSQNRLNVFSPKVQRRHRYLPALMPVAAEPVLSGYKAGNDGKKKSD
ncbi:MULTISPECIES: hypothetical protein [unclassified Rhodanobacter]|uniref:hypothetical protein n=1 Tax=unclassified Rhodanobacter TaxID=2621553 RepID=UPI001BDFAED1|nr:MULTISPECIES: hypothetical protein [unclassified Rhodanobacter]MBT2145634.1 hypothetical protein [Rhodanobacter sp. LX-99]MBT2149679.1 hypothetical protein [Rhodanobacter sp. LX-100]